MDHFEQPSAKLLYLINEMNRLKMITQLEKCTLKQFILQEHQGIYDLLKQYPKSDTELELAEAIIILLRGAPNSGQQQVQDDGEYQADLVITDDLQSPLGNQLMSRKNYKQKKHQQQDSRPFELNKIQ
ncbi:unnamed protein product (macronuclear) [Paramecium tetraurelia]|uniref:Uncharacterized protein n=1 Tax=Paramecium tetraurelia TaxID=5888 RepID=A0E426_PARTE|nr:uncharacterized protein GSPATT00023216001 [Paramecium tetraurelia]CAK90043.1 unnamed protein product [Paramecium tetraurelia]|eukprot:XP_001457440.1 hypothetical protein (macronuclear) [Paramecium tetraurelia strain d4-2]